MVNDVDHHAALVDDEGGAAVDFQHRPHHAVLLADDARLVADEGELQALGRGEAAVLLGLVDGDADELGVERGNLLVVVAEVADLERAGRREGLREEEEHHALLPAELGQPHLAAPAVGGLEVRGDVADAQHLSCSLTAGRCAPEASPGGPFSPPSRPSTASRRRPSARRTLPGWRRWRRACSPCPPPRPPRRCRSRGPP